MTRPEQTRPDQTIPDHTRPDQIRPDQNRPDQTRPDQDQTRLDQTTRPDQTRPDHPLGLPQAPLCRLLWPKFQATPTTKGWLEKKCACYNRVGARWGFFRSMSYFIVKLQVPSSEFQAPSSKLKCCDVIKSKFQVPSGRCVSSGNENGT